MQPVSTVRFTPVRLRPGYAMKDVDEFLDSIEKLPLEERPTNTRNARFTPVRVREGYDMDEVDAYLDELVEHYEAQLRREALPAAEAEVSKPTLSKNSIEVEQVRSHAQEVLSRGYSNPTEIELAEAVLALLPAHERLVRWAEDLKTEGIAG